MHGLLLSELRTLVRSTYGPAAWQRVVDAAGVTEPTFLATTAYPDSETVALFRAGADVLGTTRETLQRAVGRQFGVVVLDLAAPAVGEDWDAFDLLEQLEDTVSGVVRSDLPAARPPSVGTVRLDDETIHLSYHSERRLCALAIGIVESVGDHFQTDLAVRETSCLHDGDSTCTLVVTRR